MVLQIVMGGKCSASIVIPAPFTMVSMRFLTAVILLCALRRQLLAIDAFNNYVMNPAKDSVIDGAVEAAGLGEAVNTYSQISNSAFNKTSTLTRTGRFVYNNFFQ